MVVPMLTEPVSKTGLETTVTVSAKLHVDCQLLCHSKLDLLTRLNLESLLREHQFIFSRRQHRKIVTTLVVRCSRRFDIRLDVSNGHVRARDDRAIRVSHLSRD